MATGVLHDLNLLLVKLRDAVFEASISLGHWEKASAYGSLNIEGLRWVLSTMSRIGFPLAFWPCFIVVVKQISHHLVHPALRTFINKACITATTMGRNTLAWGWYSSNWGKFLCILAAVLRHWVTSAELRASWRQVMGQHTLSTHSKWHPSLFKPGRRWRRQREWQDKREREASQAILWVGR